MQGSGVNTSSTAVGALAQSLSCRRPLPGRATGIFCSCCSRRTTPFRSSSAASPRSGKPFSSWPLRKKSIQFKSKSTTARLMPSFSILGETRAARMRGKGGGQGRSFSGGGKNLTERLFQRFCSCRQTPSLPCTSFLRLRAATRVARARGQIPDDGHCRLACLGALCANQ